MASEREQLKALSDLAEKQSGVVAAWQAGSLGLSRDQFERLVGTGGYKRLSRGLYRGAAAPSTHESRLWSACLVTHGVASHRTAAWLWGLDGFDELPWKLDLIVPFENKRTAKGAKVHRSRSFVKAHRCKRNGVPCTNLARTVVDLSQIVSGKALEIAVASAVRLEPKLYEQVDEVLATLPANALVRLKNLRPLLQKRDKALESALEAVVLRFLRRSKLPEPELQKRVFDGNALIGRFDFAWPDNEPPVVLQAHGQRYHGNTEQWLRDMQQASELNEIGWRVIQCSMSDVTKRQVRLAQMLRRALAGHRGDGVYRDDYLRDPEVDAMPERSARQKRL
ncbi:MAG: hypothetical protein QM723_30555 [Myxococcaceae bacterium]